MIWAIASANPQLATKADLARLEVKLITTQIAVAALVVALIKLF